MNIRELNSYVRERCGLPSVDLLKSEEIDLAVLEELQIRQTQMTAAGKPVRSLVFEYTLTDKRAEIALGSNAGKVTGFPDYVRIDMLGKGVFDLLRIVTDVDALMAAEEGGLYAILFFAEPLSYEVSWKPAGEKVEFWWDRSVMTFLEVMTDGTKLPPQFDYAVGNAAALRVMPLVAMRDERRRTFIELQTRSLERDLLRWDSLWQQFLFQSAAAGSVTQQMRYRGNRGRRTPRFPY